MTYILRDYQKQAVDKSLEFFRSNDKSKPMVILPTGGGKSLVIAYIAKELNDKILILQPTKELLEQNYIKYDNAIKDHVDLSKATVYSASIGIKEISNITFAMIGSIYKNPELFSDFKYIIIDECHRVPPKKDKLNKKDELVEKASMYRSFLESIPNVKVLGLSASPFRLKSYTDYYTGSKYSQINLLNREKPSFFNKFIHITQIKELYDLGFLCPINYIKMQWDGSFLQVNSTGAEYTDNSLKEAIKRNEIIEKIPGILDQAYKKERKNCLVFVRSVDEARYLSTLTPFSGYVHAETEKKERARIIKAFKNGDIKTVFNVGILTEGFDFPELDTVIIARPTMSLGLYMQMIGRGIRTHKNKEYLSLLDMCGNIDKFGKIEDIIIENDDIHGWVLRNNNNILSGRRLDNL